MPDEENSQNDSTITNLLDELSKSRKILQEDADQVSKIKQQLTSFIDTNRDLRSKFALDDKLKVLSSFNTMSLNLRQEINRSIVQEIEIRRKMKDDGVSHSSYFRDQIDSILKQSGNNLIDD